MRWYRSYPSPTNDSTQRITKVYDGDGLDVKRVDTNAWFHTFPDTDSGTNSTTEYYVRSTVLGGQVLTKLDGAGAKKLTNVYTGSGVLAEQRVISGSSGVYWKHEDLVTGSYYKVGSNGQIGGHAEDSLAAIEYDPLGGSIPTADPNYDLVPAGLSQFKFAGDNSRAEYGCAWDGAPIRCDMLGAALRYSNSAQIHVNTRSEGGYNLYSTLNSLVSTWRYNVWKESRPGTPDRTPDRADGTIRVGTDRMLLGSFYVSYLSSLGEGLIEKWDHRKYFDTPSAGPGARHLLFRGTGAAKSFLDNALAGECGRKIAELIDKFAAVTGIAARTNNLSELFQQITDQTRGGFLFNIPLGDNLDRLMTAEKKQYYGESYKNDINRIAFGLSTRLLDGTFNLGGQRRQFNGEALVYMQERVFYNDLGSYGHAQILLTTLIHELIHVAASGANTYEHDNNQKLLEAVKSLKASSVDNYIGQHCRPR